MKNESGASTAEYALIIAIVGAAVVFAAVTLGPTIENAIKADTPAEVQP